MTDVARINLYRDGDGRLMGRSNLDAGGVSLCYPYRDADGRLKFRGANSGVVVGSAYRGANGQVAGRAAASQLECPDTRLHYYYAPYILVSVDGGSLEQYDFHFAGDAIPGGGTWSGDGYSGPEGVMGRTTISTLPAWVFTPTGETGRYSETRNLLGYNPYNHTWSALSGIVVEKPDGLDIVFPDEVEASMSYPSTITADVAGFADGYNPYYTYCEESFINGEYTMSRVELLKWRSSVRNGGTSAYYCRTASYVEFQWYMNPVSDDCDLGWSRYDDGRGNWSIAERSYYQNSEEWLGDVSGSYGSEASCGQSIPTGEPVYGSGYGPEGATVEIVAP